MNFDYELNINLLIIKYVNGTISDQEAALLADWVKESEQNVIYFRTMCRSFEQHLPDNAEAEAFWNRIKPTLNQNIPAAAPRKRSGLLKAISVAASVIIVLGCVAFWGLTRSGSTEQLPLTAQQTPTEAIQPTAIAEASLAEVVYTTSADEHKRITLPDGSIVILNSNSRLTQCEGFNEQERNVTLCGEAYFDVAKSNKRFTVHTSDRSYIVHGTSFNIFDYGDKHCSIVTLHTGKLEARVKNDAYMLMPGEELRVDEQTQSVSKLSVNVEDSIGWLDKKLKFSRLPLKFVANQLSHKYGVKINIHHSIEDIVYTGQLDNEDITTALHLISITAPIKIAVTEFDGEYYISKHEI